MRFNPNNDRGTKAKYLSLWQKGKVYTLLEYAGSSGDISDPYGGDLEEYEEVAQEIYDALVDVAEKIADMQSKK